MRRVVVTGLGLVTPLGTGVKPVWDRLLNGESGINSIQNFDVSDLPAKIAGQPPKGETSEGGFNADDWMAPKEQRKVDRFIVYGMAAAQQAPAWQGLADGVQGDGVLESIPTAPLIEAGGAGATPAVHVDETPLRVE